MSVWRFEKSAGTVVTHATTSKTFSEVPTEPSLQKRDSDTSCILSIRLARANNQKTNDAAISLKRHLRLLPNAAFAGNPLNFRQRRLQKRHAVLCCEHVG